MTLLPQAELAYAALSYDMMQIMFGLSGNRNLLEWRSYLPHIRSAMRHAGLVSELGVELRTPNAIAVEMTVVHSAI